MANDSKIPQKDTSVPRDKLHLHILSPEATVYDDIVDEVILPTQKGEIAVLPQHVALFTKLAQGELKVKKGNSENTIIIFGGFLEVQNNHVTVLSDYAIRAESIEVAKAEEAKKRAEEVMRNKGENVDFVLAEKELQKSLLTLKAAEKYRKRRTP